MLILAFGTNSALSYQFFPGFSSKWVPQYLIAIKHQRWWNTYTEYYMSPEVCESAKHPLLLLREDVRGVATPFFQDWFYIPSGLLAIRISGYPVFRPSGHLPIRPSGHPVIWSSRLLTIQTSSHQVF